MHLNAIAKPLVFLTADTLIGIVFSSYIDGKTKLIWATRIAVPLFALSTFYGAKKYHIRSIYGLGICIGLNTPKCLQTEDKVKKLEMMAAAFILTLLAKAHTLIKNE